MQATFPRELRYQEALDEFEVIRRLHPGDAEIVKTVAYLQRRLDVPTYHAHVTELHTARGDSAAARQALERGRTFGVSPAPSPRIELHHGDLAAAADQIRRLRPVQPGGHMLRHDALGDVHARMGDHARAAAHADSLLRYAAAVADRAPGAPPAEHAALATVHAGLAHLRLGHPDSARALIRVGLEAEAPFEDHVAGVLVRIAAARGYTRLGEYERALELLEVVRAGPSPLSEADLRLDPEWEGLRGRPGGV